jgi:polysaccharide biosynthesis protein PslH
VLVLAPFPPRRDALHGGARVIAHLLVRLADQNEIALLCLRRANDLPVDEFLASRLVHLDEVAHGRGRSSHRFRSLILDYAALMLGTPSWVRAVRSAEFERRVRDVMRTWRPDLVQLEYPVMGHYVNALDDSSAPRLLVEHDLAVAAARELLPQRQGAGRIRAYAELRAWTRFERRLLARVNAVAVFTERDAVAARALGNTRVLVIPLGADVPAAPLDPPADSSPSLVFIGSFVHEPNVDAAVRLASRIFPPLRERFQDLTLELVGHAAPAAVRALPGDRIRVHSDVPDVTPFLQRAAVVVVPLRLGGGMRVKVVEALAAGKAVVASPRALEGIAALPGQHLLRAETDDEFVDAVASLVLDPTRRTSLGFAAHEWAREHLSWDRSATRFHQIYDELAPRSSTQSRGRWSG